MVTISQAIILWESHLKVWDLMKSNPKWSRTLDDIFLKLFVGSRRVGSHLLENWDHMGSQSENGIVSHLRGSWKIFTIGLLCFSWLRILKFYVYVYFLVYNVYMNFDFRKKSILAFYTIRMSESIRGEMLNVD